MQCIQKSARERRKLAGRATLAYILLAVPFIIVMQMLIPPPLGVVITGIALLAGAYGLRRLWSNAS